ncbi:hypothetical protein, partial [Arachnia propionica]|uniref:hypothetical protein n=1 Tax=Arachnia propionica TaxID=1750 RepID=UPI001C8AC08B
MSTKAGKTLVSSQCPKTAQQTIRVKTLGCITSPLQPQRARQAAQNIDSHGQPRHTAQLPHFVGDADGETSDSPNLKSALGSTGGTNRTVSNAAV